MVGPYWPSTRCYALGGACEPSGRAPSRFGLVNVPVKVYAATEDHDVPLHQVHDADGGRIRYQRRCEICGKIVDYEHIDKAYDDGDRTVVLTDEDLNRCRPSAAARSTWSSSCRPTRSTPSCSTRATTWSRTRSRPRPTCCCGATLEETDRMAIVQFALRQKTRLGALRVRGDVLLLQSLLWDDEVREADFPSLEDRHPHPASASSRCRRRWCDSFAVGLRAREVHRRVPGCSCSS